MSPTGLVLDDFLNNLFHQWDKHPVVLPYFQNAKRDNNGHSSSSDSDDSSSSSSSSSHQSGGGGSNLDSSSNNDGHGNSSSSSGNDDGSNSGSSSSNGNSSSGSANSGNSNNSSSKSVGGGKSDNNNNNNAGGGNTQFKTITATFSTSSPTTPTGEDSLASITAFVIPSTTLDSSAPSSTSAVLSPTEQQAISHIALPLGSIVAIILGILFCMAIAGVIYVVTRPKFGSLGRLWKNSRVSTPYLPSIASYEPKEFRDSSNLYRPYRPQGAQDLSSFQFGSQGGLAGHRTGNNGTSLGGYGNFQTQTQTQIYSTPQPRSISPKAERTSASSHAGESENDILESLNRIMSMMDRYHFERNSTVDSGQISPTLSEGFYLHDTQHKHSDYPHSVGPETTSVE